MVNKLFFSSSVTGVELVRSPPPPPPLESYLGRKTNYIMCDHVFRNCNTYRISNHKYDSVTFPEHQEYYFMNGLFPKKNIKEFLTTNNHPEVLYH